MGRNIKYKILKFVLIKEYINNGKTMKQIAKIIGCNWGTIRQRLLKYKIPIRNKSENSLGKNNGFFGKKHSKTSLKKMSKVHKGHKAIIEACKKMSKSQKKRFEIGAIPWNKGKRMNKVKHHIYGRKYKDLLILTNSQHGKLHSNAYFYILKKYGKKGINKYIKWFKGRFKI